MKKSVRSLRVMVLAVLFALALGATGVVSARPPVSVDPLQEATATPIDSSNPVKLDFGKPFETPLNYDDLSVAYLTFKGKANQIVDVTVDKVKGNFSYTVRITSQNDVDLALLSGDFAESLRGTVKLPQDGNYRVTVSSGKPGAGDLEPGSVSVTVSEAKPKTAATAAATAAK